MDDEKYRSFVFPESVFTAVTAYQNQLVTIRLYIHIRSRYFFYNTLKAYAVYLLDVHMNAVCGSVRFAVYTRVYYAQFYTLRQSYACVLSTTILIVLPVSSSSVVLGDLVDSLIRPRCGSRISRTGRGQRASVAAARPAKASFVFSFFSPVFSIRSSRVTPFRRRLYAEHSVPLKITKKKMSVHFLSFIRVYRVRTRKQKNL